MKWAVFILCLGVGCVANQSEMSAGFVAVQKKIDQKAAEIQDATQLGVAAIQQQAECIKSEVQQGIVNYSKTDNRTYDPVKDYLVYAGFIVIAVVLLTKPAVKALCKLGARMRRDSG